MFTWRKTDNVNHEPYEHIHEHTWTFMNIRANKHDRPRVKNSVIEFSFNAWMTHSAAIIFNTTENDCHDSQNITNMVSQLILPHPIPTQKSNWVSNRVSNRVKIVFKVSKYTNIFGMVQMLEAFCLAPFVGAVIDFSGPVLSVYRRTIPWRTVPFNVRTFLKNRKISKFLTNFWQINRKISKMIHLMKNACFTS